MTTPSLNSKPETPWFARPGVIVSFLGICVLLTALFMKTPTIGRDGDPRLTTKSADPLGAKLFYELAGRMGYTTLRGSNAQLPGGPHLILAVLDPVAELNAVEVHDMMQHLRAGGALLVVLGAHTDVLSDSLHITVEELGAAVIPRLGSTRQCATGFVFTRNGLWLGPATLFALKIPDSLRHDMRTFTFVDMYGGTRSDTAGPRPSTVGLPVGAGRVVVASDPDILRNDALRVCGYGLDIAATDALQYLSGGGTTERRTIIFDEFHQRGISRTGMVALMRQYLFEVPSGRALLQLCAAGLVLLIAAIPRVLPPREDRRLERRSPLEHVDALARAYAQVGATRTGALRLVRGMQRRLGRNSTRAGANRSDEEFLTRIADSKPALAADVATIRHALHTTVNPTQFIDVGNAIHRVEAALTRT